MLENELLEKCSNGDGIAFKRLINIYRIQLFGYLWRFSSSRFEAEEMFQETLIKVWKGFKKYDHRQKFSSWLFTIAHNVAMDQLRKRKTDTAAISIQENLEIENDKRPDEELINKEKIEIINRTVENLPEKQKSVFLLRQHGELTFKDIAEILNEPLNTVISHMHYAVKKIKKQLAYENESQRRSVI
ncbi:MAG: RNA polymerase sigma factor [Ignavibacteriae bacterium]|nr:RNA polymerase sigma factor [Ignavibacteriota bacterium]